MPPSRRQFIRNLSLGAAAASALPLASLAGANRPEPAPGLASPFLHGVASGDPLRDRVILWTRVSPQRPGRVPVIWELSPNPKFRSILRAGVFVTGPERDYTVKVDAGALAADATYYYRFRIGQHYSPVGKTRTLPVGQVGRVRLAVFSCSNYPAGYFHAYREAARLTDVHAAVHLGDFLYEYQRGGYASADAATLGREVLPPTELNSLDDYRQRHAQYRGDPDLQAAMAALPFICVWDDHEIANDTWRDGADNHDPATEGDFTQRRNAALQAYFEWMPVRLADPAEPLAIQRSFDFGNLLSLHMLETRLNARDKPLAYGDYFSSTGSFDALRFATELADPTRQLLGGPQLAWLADQLTQSSAQWQVLGQQTLMGTMHLPAPLVLGQIGFAAYAALLAKAQANPASLSAQEQALLAQPRIPYNLDAWDGYPAERERVLALARDLDKNLVVLAGDTHNAWASNLEDGQGQPVGVEFATASVSSPGLEEYLPDEDPAALAAALPRIIEPLEYAETAHRGFLLVTFTSQECRAEWRLLSTVKNRDYHPLATASLAVQPGPAQRRLEA
ncbi:MAG: alkaline phosphatase D family protein [Rhodocyclaceae bacterium]|jgi:alkaline phosphatase D|nr:alkaline phosphatase D family protein [Rhodocyclaceae bacterium]